MLSGFAVAAPVLPAAPPPPAEPATTQPTPPGSLAADEGASGHLSRLAAGRQSHSGLRLDRLSFTASSDAHEQLPMGFNYKANQFLVQQNWLRIDRPVDPDQHDADLGLSLAIPSSAAPIIASPSARGLFDSQLSAAHGEPATYGIDPIQFVSRTVRSRRSAAASMSSSAASSPSTASRATTPRRTPSARGLTRSSTIRSRIPAS